MALTCPKCRGEMHQYERNGITVDQCTECRGIFLDRGELERLIDAEKRWANEPTTPAPAPVSPPVSAPSGRPYPDPQMQGDPRADDRYRDDKYRDDRYRDDKYREQKYDSRYSGYPPKKRKKSFIEELFD